MDNNTVEQLREIEAMTRSGNVTDAVNLSGEVLAETNYKWEKAAGKRLFDSEMTELLAEAAAVHVRALVASNEPTIAATTAVAILMQLSIDTSDNINLDIARLELLNNAINALAAHINRNEPSPSQDVVEHYMTILRYMISVIYALYNKINKMQPQCCILPSVYLTLKQFIAENVPVDTPAVNVNGKDTDPFHASDIYADILGRMKALGLI